MTVSTDTLEDTMKDMTDTLTRNGQYRLVSVEIWDGMFLFHYDPLGEHSHGIMVTVPDADFITAQRWAHGEAGIDVWSVSGNTDDDVALCMFHAASVADSGFFGIVPVTDCRTLSDGSATDRLVAGLQAELSDMSAAVVG